MFGIYGKYIVYGILGAAAIAFGITAVVTYRSAIRSNAELRLQVGEANAKVQSLDNAVRRLQTYAAKKERRAAKEKAALTKIYSTESARDAQGNILPADNVLALLNGMFPGPGGEVHSAGPADNSNLRR